MSRAVSERAFGSGMAGGRRLLAAAGASVALAGGLLGGLVAGGCGRSETDQAGAAGRDGAAVESTSGSGGAGAPGRAALGDEGAAAELRLDDDLAEIRAELAKADLSGMESFEDRLARAQAWIAANRDADSPFNPVEAEILALWDEMFTTGAPISIDRLIKVMEVEMVMTRVMDIDGDGQVSESEMDKYMAFAMGQMANPFEHPYMQSRLDTDGDGVLSEQEKAALMRSMQEDQAKMMQPVMDRALLQAWDADRDGVLSAEERESAMAKALENMPGWAEGLKSISSMDEEQLAATREGLRSALERIDAAEGVSDEMKSAQKMAIEEQLRQFEMPPEERAALMRQQMEQVAQWTIAGPYFGMLRMEQDDMMDPGAWQKALSEDEPIEPPQPPTPDADGDGLTSDEEQALFDSELESYNARMQEYAQEQANRQQQRIQQFMRQQMRGRFDNALASGDLDGDGRMTDEEWDERISRRRTERDAALFLHHYDLDGDKRVGGGEVDQFMDWYRSGSLRADADVDGEVNVGDLQHFLSTYENVSGE